MKRALAMMLLASACSRYEPPVVEGAVVQIAFENNLENLGEAALDEAVIRHGATFRKGAAGRALFTRGNGGSVELTAPQPMVFSGSAAAIAFDFNREDWANPYEHGRGTQTIAVVSGRTADRIEHIAFNASPTPSGNLYVRFTDADGAKHSLAGGEGSASVGAWRNVRLNIDRARRRTELFVNGDMVDAVDASPVLIDYGVSSVKLGTWYKKNQAYRGHVDNFVIVDL
jgi:hypothetical protein